MKGKEEYKTLKSSLSNVICDVNRLIDDPHMIIDGKKVKLQFYLGGDYKVRLQLASATVVIIIVAAYIIIVIRIYTILYKWISI